MFRAADGYTDSVPLSVALNNGCFLAYQMNGAPLVQKHGYPARLLVPDIYGMKNVKWITEVELATSDYKGYWECAGLGRRSASTRPCRASTTPTRA